MEKKPRCSAFFKRIISFAVAIVMLLSYFPATTVYASQEGTALYLKPNANWNKDNARFAVYYWQDSVSGWADMSDEDGDGYYEGTVPAGYSNVIFCRMNPNASANDWTNKWNQTADLTVPQDGTNCYIVAENTWDAGGGEWVAYSDGEDETPEENETPEEPAVQDYYLIGYINGKDYGCNDDYSNLGEYKFVDGKLTATFTQDSYVFLKTGDNANWYMTESYCSATTGTFKNTTTGTSEKMFVPGNQELTFTLVVNADDTLTLSYAAAAEKPEEPAVQDYYLIGYINGKDYGCNDDYANLGEYKFVDGKLTATFTQDSYVFLKTGDNANWYMTESYCSATTGTFKNTTTGTSEKMFVPGNQELTFTLVVNADDTLTLSYAAAAEEPEVPEIPEGYTVVTIHFLKSEGWGSTVNAYTWNGVDMGNWPGKAIPANASHPGWYDLIAATEKPTGFSFIFNDGGNQTADLSTGEITGDTELWVVGNEVFRTAPGAWSGDYSYTAYLHFQKPENWGETVNVYTWNGVDMGSWPGAEAEADSVNNGWYNVSATMKENTGFNFIFNDGSNQTADLFTGALRETTHLWIVNGAVAQTAPTGWVDASRTVHVPGTFPGPSWDAGSNQMTYDADLGLYVYTFQNVPAANYEYKIAINKSWNENYGAGGVKDGANMSISVPETMDVTVYYNDRSHFSATSLTYIFADITLSGADIPVGTKLRDNDLSGIYSASVDMAAGIYTDVKLTYNGEDYLFEKIEVEEDKLVTFYMDPVTEIYYNDASGLPIDAESVFFDSQDETYKAPFGAVATGEEITFSIDTGADITSAVLVIKGLDSYPMELNETESDSAEETKRWSSTVSIDRAGEYEYYFTLSNGSMVSIYGDDDGYYGEGTLTNLNEVKPYDLVVYKAGFETPDWMKNAVIYQIFPDRFFDGDVTNNQAQTWARGDVNYEYITNWYTLPENPEQEAMLDKNAYLSSGAHYGDGEWSNEIYGGDLAGITQRIDYLKALGVNVIYLNPVFWSISNHRYDAVDYTEIDPILGTLGDFQELVSVAEANGMHIILDGVFNHVSDDSVYFDRYYKFLGKSEKIGAYPYWAYVYDYMNDNGVDQATAVAAAKAYFGENYGITDYSYTEWFGVSSTTMAGTVDEIGLRAGKEVYAYEGWWGYDSMPVIKSTNGSEYQTGNWAGEIISGSNSVNAYWIGKGMDGWRLDVANEVSDETWQNFRASVKALNSDAVIIGEIWDDATKYLKGDMYDSVMNYVFRNAVTSYAMGTSAEDTAKTMEKLRERYPEEAFYAMMNLVGSHDTTRILSYLDGIGDDRNQKDFDSAFPTYAKTSTLAKNRQYLVSFLQFTYAGAPTIYYGDEIGMVGSDDPDDRRAFEWGKGNQKLVEWYATLAAIRSAYPALRTGSVKMLELNDQNLMGFVRSDKEDTLTVIANNSQSAKSVSLEGSYINVLTGETFNGTVPALNGVILVSSEDVKEISTNLSGLAPAYDSSYIVAERPDHAHQWDEGTVTKEATCTEAGELTYKCTTCGETKTEAIEASGHSHEAVVTAPTCTEQGYTTYTCTCGDSYVADYVDAIGHTYETVVTAPTCTAQGYTTYTCTCGDSYVDDYVDATGHNVVLMESEDPTCELTGYEYYACEHCGGEEYTILKEATGHSYSDGKCTVCGEKDPNANVGGWLSDLIGGLLDRWFGWGDSEGPTDPPEPSEPEKPGKPEKPTKPNWGWIWDWIFS